MKGAIVRRTARLPSAVLACAALLLTGCSATPGDTGTTLDVFVAASLAGPVARIAEDFEAAHPGMSVRLSPGGSSGLVAQALAGAPADVVVTADERTMARLTGDPDLAGDAPVAVAANTPTLVVPADASDRVATLADAATSRLVVCAPQVPCGDAALRLAAAAGVTLRPVSEEASVTDVLAKVASGEADAGIVYATDARPAVAAGTVREIPVPGAASVINRALAVALDGPDAALARELVAALTGERGQALLREAGFGAP